MDSIKWLLDKNTRHGRGIRTALQGAFAILTFLAGLLALPGLGELLAANELMTVGTFGVWVGVVSYLHNALEDLIERLG